jgi:hypothetical protein
MSLIARLVLFAWISVVICATKCEFCNKEFTCLGRHTWRCPAKSTSSQSTVIQPTRLDNTPIHKSDVNNAVPISPTPEDDLISCVCGRRCKGRRGLTMHQRSCKTSRQTLDQHQEHANSALPSPHPTAASSSTSTPPESGTPLSAPDPSPALDGVKLPKSKAGWDEANLFFKLNIDLSAPITDVHAFTLSFQKSIYDYLQITLALFIRSVTRHSI